MDSGFAAARRPGMTQLFRQPRKLALPVVTGSPQRGPRDARVAGCPARGRAGTAVKHRKTACSHLGNTVYQGMRVIARNTLAGFWDKHPEAKASLTRWYSLVRAAHWVSTDDVQKAAPKAKVLNRERVR